MNEKMLIIIPTYNERNNLPRLAEAIFAQGPFHLLIVDDNSPDGTGNLAEALAQQYPGRLHVRHRAGKLGLGTAYIEGFRWGLAQGYDLLFEMDADFSHDARHLPQFVEGIRQGADLVLGSRYTAGGGTRNWSLGRRVLSRGGSLYAQTILGLPIRDLTSGFKCFRRSVLESIDLGAVGSNGYSFQIEMTYQAVQKGFRVVETPIIFVDRQVGQSKMHGGIVAEALTLVWRLRLAPQGGGGTTAPRARTAAPRVPAVPERPPARATTMPDGGAWLIAPAGDAAADDPPLLGATAASTSLRGRPG